MDTLTTSFISRYTRVRLSTERSTEFIDITDGLNAFIRGAGIGLGMLNVQTLHTTTGLVVNEHEPRLLEDFAATLGRFAPADAAYRHDDRQARDVEDERPNGHAHCRALALPTSVCLNVIDGGLVLGRWQRVFFVELDGPRHRDLSVLLLGESCR